MTIQSLTEQIRNKASFLCVGLDSDLAKLPPAVRNHPEAQFAFNKAIIEATHARICSIAPQLDMNMEVLYIDDGSHDSTLKKLKNLASEDSRIAVIEFSRNFGQQAAMSAGLEMAQGDAVVIIDADLQDPPALIGEMLVHWREGYDVVYAVRRQRSGESRTKRFTAYSFYRLMERLLPRLLLIVWVYVMMDHFLILINWNL